MRVSQLGKPFIQAPWFARFGFSCFVEDIGAPLKG
jgi:hypothetical protein